MAIPFIVCVAFVFLALSPFVWGKLLRPLERFGWMLGTILAIVELLTWVVGSVEFQYRFAIGAMALIVLVVTAIWPRLRKTDEKGETIKVEVAVPRPSVLDLEPLPHYRGHVLPPSIKRGFAGIPLAEKGITMQKVNEPPSYSHPDAKLLRDSQWIALSVFPPPSYSPRTILIAKFGVIQVHSLSGDVKSCKAEIRYRTLEESSKAINDDWHSGGYLNWSSPELKEKLFQTAMKNTPNFEAQLGCGINAHLVNTEQDITEGQRKDFLLFYMIKGNPSVFLCTSLESVPAGVAQNGNPVKFEVEITLTGKGYNTSIWVYRVTALWDDFEILRVR